MRTREEVVTYIRAGNKNWTRYLEKGGCSHFGLQELRMIMDYIYEEAPQNEAEELTAGDFKLNTFY